MNLSATSSAGTQKLELGSNEDFLRTKGQKVEWSGWSHTNTLDTHSFLFQKNVFIFSQTPHLFTLTMKTQSMNQSMVMCQKHELVQD